jgi:hypothetical protein
MAWGPTGAGGPAGQCGKGIGEALGALDALGEGDGATPVDD